MDEEPLMQAQERNFQRLDDKVAETEKRIAVIKECIGLIGKDRPLPERLEIFLPENSKYRTQREMTRV